MDAIFGVITDLEPFHHFYFAILLATAVFLIGLGLVIFVAPERAKRFLSGFASTLSLNTLEALLRLLVGVSLAGFANNTGLPELVAYIGIFIAASAVVMLLLPSVHKRFGEWAIPFALKILPAYGAGAILLGIILGLTTLFG